MFDVCESGRGKVKESMGVGQLEEGRDPHHKNSLQEDLYSR